MLQCSTDVNVTGLGIALRISSEISKLTDSIRVICRFRPLIGDKETEASSTSHSLKFNDDMNTVLLNVRLKRHQK